jgi:rare lipoprotein A
LIRTSHSIRPSLLCLLLGVLSLSVLLLPGCARKQTQVEVPPPPEATPQAPASTATNTPPSTEPSDNNEIKVPAGAKPIFEQTGTASWYGPPYHNRRGSNGEIYNMNAMTAAHLTLPLGSIVRVTNLKTGHSAVLRITDRGPFVEGRILDLSLAAAKTLDVYGPGTAKVRLEVLQAPAALDIGGRWAIQIGSFADEQSAAEQADRLKRRYQTAKVLKFPSPTGSWWVRVRVTDDDRQRCQQLVRETEPAEAPVFLVRLD